MDSLASRIMLLWGWRRLACAFLAGAASALAMPPFSFPLVLFITLPVLVWLIDGAIDSGSKRRPRKLRPAFLVGWWFGFGYCLAGLYWVGNAFLVEADQFGWMMPIAVLVLTGGMALYYALAAGFARLIWPEGPARILSLAGMFGLMEWLRGHLFSGFPWNTLGYALTADLRMMQVASLLNVYALTVIAVFIFASPAALGPGRPRWLFPSLSVLLLAGVFGFGTWRLQNASDETVPGLGMRIVQANIKQTEKWVPENRQRIFEEYLRLTDQARTPPSPSAPPITHVIWTEAAPPFFLTREPMALAAIANALPGDTRLLTGSNRVDDSNPEEGPVVFNSLYVISGDGSVETVYDKVKLVPFGEFVPFEPLLDQLGITRIVPVPGSFRQGRKPMAIAAGAAPLVRPLICYEIIYPANVIGDGQRPGWFVHVTNEAWFGNSPGPRQHFHKARVRAIEEGIPVIRSANTGVSAVIDGYGRVLEQIPLNEAGVIDSALPAALAAPPAARFGNRAVLVLIVFSLLTAALGLYYENRRRSV